MIQGKAGRYNGEGKKDLKRPKLSLPSHDQYWEGSRTYEELGATSAGGRKSPTPGSNTKSSDSGYSLLDSLKNEVLSMKSLIRKG